MEVESTEPPDRGDLNREEGGGPGFPSPLAAAVTASLHEGRGAQPTGGHQPGEEMVWHGTAAAARTMQAQGAEGTGSGGGAGPCLPGSQAAAVQASLQ